MKQRGLFSRISLITKIVVGSFLGILCVGGIVGVTIFSFQHIENLFLEIIHEDVNNVVKNAEFGREISEVFANSDLVINSFVENDELLKTTGNELIASLNQISLPGASSGTEKLQQTLQEYTSKFQALLEQAKEVNRVIREQQRIHKSFEKTLEQLEESLTEKLLIMLTEGKEDETFSIEQLNTMLPEYYLTLSQIALRLNTAKQTVLTDKSSQEMLQTLFDDLNGNLIIVTTASDDLATLGKDLIELLRQYKEQIFAFYQAAEEFRTRLLAKNSSQKEVLLAVEQIDQQIVQMTGKIQSDTSGVIHSSRQAVLLLSAVVIILVLVALFYIVRVIQPLKQLADVAALLAEGDLASTVYEVNSQDEIGTLSNAFTHLILYIKAMAAAATKISQGDLAIDVTPRSDRDVLGHAFLNMSGYLDEMAHKATAIAAGDLRSEVKPRTEHDVLGKAFHQIQSLRQSIGEIMAGASQLSEASEELRQISEQMAMAAEETSQQTSLVSSNSQQISENVDAVAIAAEQMSSNIREISKNTIEATHIARTTVDIATDVSETITNLETGSQEIGNVIKVITAITQQTNLLALNATIESARAGDAGKGFAVVANEIKDLSRETAASTADIIAKLEAIQAGSQDAANGISEVSQIITQIHNLSVATASSVEEQSVTTGEIAKRMADAAHGSQDIARVITELATGAHQTSKGASEVQEAAQELAALARRLQELLSRFRI